MEPRSVVPHLVMMKLLVHKTVVAAGRWPPFTFIPQDFHFIWRTHGLVVPLFIILIFCFWWKKFMLEANLHDYSWLTCHTSGVLETYFGMSKRLARANAECHCFLSSAYWGLIVLYGNYFILAVMFFFVEEEGRMITKQLFAPPNDFTFCPLQIQPKTNFWLGLDFKLCHSTKKNLAAGKWDHCH